VFDSIRGRLLARSPSSCVIEAGGIGYAIAVPLGTYERLPATGAEAALRLHLVVREDDWRLFGFETEEERSLFRSCLGVSGVGPAIALALLSGMSPSGLRTAIDSRDATALSRVKGIGRKTAERLIVELTGKLGVPASAGAGSEVLSDAVAALIALGLDRDEAEKRLRRVPNASELPLAERVRRALRGV
jgi:Holliday junction DNA helicase RuvA